MVVIIISALIGMGLTFYQSYIRKKIDSLEPSEIQEHHPVAHVKSVLFLEIPLEKILLGYFTLTALIYTAMMLSGTYLPELEIAVLFLSGIIFLLLVYNWVMVLGIVKRFSIRVLGFIIFTGIISLLVLSRIEAPESLLIASFPYSLTLHILGVVLGLGGALVLDVMIFHFLRNFSISRRESVIMHLLSQMIVLGLIFLLVSGTALLFSEPDTYFESSGFLMKMTVVFVIIVNGVVLNLYITPKMERISFHKEAREENPVLIRTSFIVGAISGVSWFSAFLLAMLDILAVFSYSTLLITYLLLLSIGMSGGIIKKKKYEEQAPEVPK